MTDRPAVTGLRPPIEPTSRGKIGPRQSVEGRIIRKIGGEPAKPISLFYSYSHRDEDLRLRACLTRSSSHAVVSRSIILNKTFVRVLDPVCRAGSHTGLKIM